MVMAMMPGADPMISSDPPAPTVMAKNTQSAGSVVFTISRVAAVSGMLSNIEDSAPMTVLPAMMPSRVGLAEKMA